MDGALCRHLWSPIRDGRIGALISGGLSAVLGMAGLLIEAPTVRLQW